MSFNGKVCAVTGAGSGIGLATAKLLSEKGATVCIADVNAEALADAEQYFLSREPKVPFISNVLDISSKDQVERWIAGIKVQFGRLDAAANIAGVVGKDHGKKAVSELDDDEWDMIIGVNLTGTMYCLRAELQHISPKGSIVNMASIHATNGLSF
jgi:NAD(P)-dependent dehydrogenase (short-subunit alcohol dehydrogenase family)